MSEPAKWAELERLYHAALECPAAEREAFIVRECAGDAWLREELTSLLAHAQESESFLGERAIEVAARSLAESGMLSLESGTMVGAYRILEPIGRGGMGMVYRAEQQQPVRRQVALKIIKPGMDSEQVIARFRAERQALALMDHPNIARVLDAGATSAGRLYFVMELVEGLPVTEYARQHQLSLRAKLQLLVPVCQAIQHAHQKGVIHRDIKPSNVLVTMYDGKPVPKVIDFGIAKATQEPLTDWSLHTQVGSVLGTVDYMSPEQAGSGGADIDTRSDVYSVGVLLYEMITGATPLNRPSRDAANEADLLRRIREEEAAPPSARLPDAKQQREVRGDLDWVVMKALEKDRARRYGSVSALSDDIENYLAGAPVTAGPPSTAYRLKKLAQRHRGALVTIAAVLMVLVGAVVFSAREAIRARQAEQAASAVNDFLARDLLAQASANEQANYNGRPDPDLKVRTALDRAAAQVGTRFAGQPLVEAAIRHTMGATYRDLAIYGVARRHLERAIELRRRELGERHAATLESQDQLVNAYLGEGKPALAEPLAKQVLALRRQSVGERHPDTLTALHNLANVERAFARDAPAEALYRQAAELRQQVLGPEHPDTLRSLSSLGFVSMLLEKFPQAVSMHQRVLEIRRRRLGPEHPETMQARLALAQALFNANQAAEAEKQLLEVLPWRRRVLGPRHPDTFVTLNGLAMARQAQGKYLEAEATLAECVEGAGKAYGDAHPVAAACRNNLADAYQAEGKYDLAERHFRKILEIDRQATGSESPDALRSMSNLGVTLTAAGRYAEARSLLEQTVALRQRILGPRNPKTLSSMDSLATLYERQGDLELARQSFVQVVALRREVLGPKHPRTLSSMTSLADVLVELRRAREAEPLAREVLEASGKDVWAHGYRQNLLGASLAGQQRWAEAKPLLHDGYMELVRHQAGRPFSARLDLERAERRWRALP